MKNMYTLITGSCSDIGKEVCLRLAPSSQLLLHGRNIESLYNLKSSLPNSNRHLIWQYDFMDGSNLCSDFMEFIVDNEIFINKVAHIAGIAEFFPVHLLNSRTIKSSFDVNFYSILDILSILLKKKFRSFLESIVLISSIAVHSATGRGMAAYTSSKAAMEIYAKSIAAEIAPVRINSLALGGIITNKNDGISQSLDSDVSSYPLGIGLPENVADMVLFLLSNNASWITGQTFIVDGGYSIFRK